MKPRITIYRRDNKTNKRTDKLEIFVLKDGAVIHRHGLTENTELNRNMFPDHRVFWGSIYYNQELLIVSDELKQILSALGNPHLKKVTHFGWFKRLLCRIIAYSG